MATVLYKSDKHAFLVSVTWPKRAGKLYRATVTADAGPHKRGDLITAPKSSFYCNRYKGLYPWQPRL